MDELVVTFRVMIVERAIFRLDRHSGDFSSEREAQIHIQDQLKKIDPEVRNQFSYTIIPIYKIRTT